MLKGSWAINEGMVEISSFWDRARAVGGTVRSAFAPAPETTDALGGFYGASSETQEMFSLIEARIEEARAMALARGERPTLEDYRQACVAFGNTPEGQALATPDAEHPHGRWNPRSYSNLSSQGQNGAGHNLSGFALSEPQKRVMSDLLDLDSDHTISDFYTNIDFTGANLNNAYVDPATSFNDEIAKAGNLDGLTFNNMSADDPAFIFGAGKYTNIKMTNIQGGEIIFGNNSHVDGLTIDGASARVSIGDRARVSDVNALNGFSMMLLSMGEGSLLSNADLTNATISQASEFGQGATLQSVTFGSNVSGVDFEAVTLNKVVFNGSNLSDTSFAGATLNGVAFNGIDPATLDLSGVQRMSGVTVNGKPIASARDLEIMQLAGGVTIPIWSPELITPAPVTSQIAKVIDPLAETNPNDTLAGLGRIQAETLAAATNLASGAIKDLAPTQISGAQHVASLSEALAGGYNPAKDLVARVQPEVSMTMTMPGSNA